MHPLWPRRKRAERTVWRILTRDSCVKAADPDDVVDILRPVLNGVAEPVSFTREESLAASGQVEPAGPGTCLRTKEKPSPAAEGTTG